MTKAEWAKICEVSKPAVTQAIQRGTLVEAEGHVDVREPLNLRYFANVWARLTTRYHGLPPGWAVIGTTDDGKKLGVALLYAPPHVPEMIGAAEVDTTGNRITTMDGWQINIPAGTAVSREGKEHRIMVVGDLDLLPGKAGGK